MIEHKTGDMFREDVEALVNSVNCVGVMGRGIALQFKRRFPENFKRYAEACKRDQVQPGRMFTFATGQLTNPRYIINFPTKRHWRGKSRIEDIESGLRDLAREIEDRGIGSIAIPPLGSDLGGLRWAEVRPRIVEALQDLHGVKVLVFEPGSGPSDGRPNPSTNVPKMTPPRAALVALMRRYLGGLLDPFVTLLEVHKLLYFMQLANEPLRLKFEKGTYGPYATNLRHLLSRVEGHLVSGYTDGVDAPDKPLELVPGATDDAEAFLEGFPEMKHRLERVADLVEGFETSFGMELLATVHWVVTEHPTATDDEVIAYTHSWGPRKRQFSERHIRIALRVLGSKGWLRPSAERTTI
ncbi:MAG: macro domain-containing protein [Chloroflexota bacterium]|nr:macro domain-containing protein [Chloroflexota bacterium]